MRRRSSHPPGAWPPLACGSVFCRSCRSCNPYLQTLLQCEVCGCPRIVRNGTMDIEIHGGVTFLPVDRLWEYTNAEVCPLSWMRFFRRRQWDRDRAQEIEAYLDLETQDNLSRGMSREEARRAARRKLG